MIPATYNSAALDAEARHHRATAVRNNVVMAIGAHVPMAVAQVENTRKFNWSETAV